MGQKQTKKDGTEYTEMSPPPPYPPVYSCAKRPSRVQTADVAKRPSRVQETAIAPHDPAERKRLRVAVDLIEANERARVIKAAGKVKTEEIEHAHLIPGDYLLHGDYVGVIQADPGTIKMLYEPVTNKYGIKVLRKISSSYDMPIRAYFYPHDRLLVKPREGMVV